MFHNNNDDDDDDDDTATSDDEVNNYNDYHHHHHHHRHHEDHNDESFTKSNNNDKNTHNNNIIHVPIVDATPSCNNNIVHATLSFPPATSTYGNRAKITEDAYVQMEDQDGSSSLGKTNFNHFLDRNNHNNNNNNNNNNTPSITSTIMTAEGLADPTGFAIICSVVLVGDMTRGITFPIMWPLVQDLGGNSVWLGYAVGAFSFGRVLASPIFGKWSIDAGYSKTLVASTAIMLVGCVFFAHVLHVNSLPFLVFSKIIMGIGSATLGVTRAYVAEITATRQRTIYMALLSAVQYGAYTVTPIFGALFCYILKDQRYEVGFFVIDQYSAAAYFMASLCIVTLFLLLTKFRARYRTKPAVKIKRSKRQLEQDELSNQRTCCCGLTIHMTAVMGCMLLNIAIVGCFGAFETMGIHFAESYYNLGPAVAGIIVSLNGMIGVCTLWNLGYLGRFFMDTQIMIGGNCIFALGMLSFVRLKSVDMGAENSIVHYIIGVMMIYGIGYPIGVTALIGLFSKVVGRISQGPLQGWFAASGSFARIVFSIMAGYISHYDNTTTVFIVLFVVSTVSSIAVAWNARILTLLSQ